MFPGQSATTILDQFKPGPHKSAVSDSAEIPSHENDSSPPKNSGTKKPTLKK